MSDYLSFLAVGVAALLVPGPDTLVVLRTALLGGSTLGVWAAAGSSAGLLLWGSATVVGVTALLTVSAVLRCAQARGGRVPVLAGRAGAALGLAGRPARRLARRGGGGNVGRRRLPPRPAVRPGERKVGMFWTALVPQFMDGSGPVMGAAMAVSMPAMAFLG